MKTLALSLISALAFAQAPQYPVLPAGGGGGSSSGPYAINLEYPFCSYASSVAYPNYGVAPSSAIHNQYASGGDGSCFYYSGGGPTLYLVIHHLLPATWDGGAISVNLAWSVGYGSGNIQFHADSVCSSASSPTYNTNTVTSSVVGTNLTVSTFTGINTSGCAPGMNLYIKLWLEAPGSGASTFTSGTVNLPLAQILLKQ